KNRSCENDDEMTSSRPAAVDMAAARPPAATRPTIGAGRPAISGLASTRMSLLRIRSAPEAALLLTVLMVVASGLMLTNPVACQLVTHDGSASTALPCTSLSMLNLVNAPTAGAVV